jgi:hypothetical protein
MFHESDLSHIESLSVSAFACPASSEQHFNGAAQVSYRARRGGTEQRPDKRGVLALEF